MRDSSASKPRVRSASDLRCEESRTNRWIQLQSSENHWMFFLYHEHPTIHANGPFRMSQNPWPSSPMGSNIPWSGDWPHDAVSMWRHSNLPQRAIDPNSQWPYSAICGPIFNILGPDNLDYQYKSISYNHIWKFSNDFWGLSNSCQAKIVVYRNTIYHDFDADIPRFLLVHGI